jgi:hypothetical protein
MSESTMDIRERDAFFSLLLQAELEDFDDMESWSYANYRSGPHYLE